MKANECALRLLLVVQFKEDVLPSPPLEPLKRQELADEVKNSCQPSANTFSLRSGRTIRTITGAPDLHMRSWKPPEPTARIMCNGVDKTTLNESQKLGEALYIVKPLLHLGAMYVHGTKSWAPWIYSLLLDVSSLALLEPKREQFMQQRPETQQMQVISRRKMNLLLYLLRSPFYDEFTRARIERALLAVADTIPLAKIVAMPLVRYLPHWQETYYYLWST